MKPDKPPITVKFHDYDSLSMEELNALVDEVLAAREARVRREARMRKADEYESRIYDLISEAQYDGFTVRINNEIVDGAYDIEVEP